MLIPVYTTRIEKDLKRMLRKRGCDVSKIKAAIILLINEKPLEIKMKNHLLRDNFKDRRECHMEPDRLLIYRFDENNPELVQ